MLRARMHDPRLIGPVAHRTPSEVERTRGPVRAVPIDLLREASQRLGILAILGAVLWSLGWIQHHVARREAGDPHWARLDIPDVIIGVVVASSIALFFYTRRRGRDPQFILDLGLVYLVFIGVAFGQMFHWRHIPSSFPVYPMISWVGPVTLMFAAIAPNTPGKTLIAGFVAASMNPVGMLIARARGTWDFGPLSNVLVMHYPDYIIAVVAALVAHIVRRLGQQVSRAREMGSYRLGELLGKGGMGEVYRATHRMLARPAAIKLIRPEMLGDKGAGAAQLTVKRFRREAEAAAQLRSPHTVELYDFGVTEDQTMYFVMELLEGMDLEELVDKKGPLPAPRVAHVLAQVCESLEEAHARGLVHRDIKPANIHLGRLGLRHDFVKVLDFGLVKSLAPGPEGGAGRQSSMETAAGLTPGTPAYMAPEVAMGESVDGRADLYALGCVGYFLLTGRLVFEASSALHVVSKHLQESPAPPSSRSELPVPRELDEILLRCLAKKPADRPASAAEVARALAEIPGEKWDEEQARRWWQTNVPG
jgi:serine/threonine-protein kinase